MKPWKPWHPSPECKELKNIIREDQRRSRWKASSPCEELPVEIAFGAIDQSDRSTAADISFLSAREDLEKEYIKPRS